MKALRLVICLVLLVLAGMQGAKANFPWFAIVDPCSGSNLYLGYTSNGVVSGYFYYICTPGLPILSSADANGGSMIMARSESNTNIRTAVQIDNTGGTVIHYHRASSDALDGSTASTGTYVAVELKNITYNGATCTATLAGTQRVSGVVTQLFSQPVGCYPNMTFESFLRADSTLGVRLNDALVFSTILTTSPPSSGNPGVGARGCPGVTGLDTVRMGVTDAAAPGDVSANTFRWTYFNNRAEMQWGGAADDPNGIGVEEYLISRNGTAIGATSSTSWVDHTVQPSTSYTYTIYARDGNMNVSPGYTFSLTTPAVSSANPRRVGVRPTGAYWGAGGEQIDLASGNLNLTIPLIKPTGRGGMTAPVNLTYNSQLWRQDTNGTWNLGGDVGFGYGWRLLVGSITPVYTDLWTIDHYIYTDSTGAEYRLDTKENGLWRGSEGSYVRYDDTKNWLILPGGNFLEMDVLSEGAEWDAGTRYPSRAFDTSANYIQFNYAQGNLAPGLNTSSRIVSVQDPRTSGKTYSFNYDSSSSLPHLASVFSSVQTAESYQLQYSPVASLVPPFGPAAGFGVSSGLTAIANSVTGVTNGFAYDPSGSGELVQMTTPNGGTFQWSYSSFTNSAGMSHREVNLRALTTLVNGTASSMTFSPGSGDTGLQLHAQRQVSDAASGALRNYLFQSDPSSPFAQLLTSEQDYDYGQTQEYRVSNYIWAQDAWGHPYVTESDITLDPGLSSAATSKTTQLMASAKTGPYGQVVSRSQYAYGNSTTPARTYNYSYTSITGGLTPMWRLASASLTAGGTAQTLITNTWDGNYANYADSPNAVLHDPTLFGAFPSGESGVPRGRLYTRSSTVGDLRVQNFSYNTTGDAVNVTLDDGSRVNYAADTTNGRYMLPSAVTPNSNSNLASSFTWASFLGLTQETDPNGATTTVGYDSAARPQSATSPDGAVTNYTYTNATSSAAATIVATINGRWTITTLDGLGRTIRTDTGTGTPSTSSSVSRVLTVYGPCACTPVGKVMQVSRPFNPSINETPVYTTYAYDPLGRTTQVTLPDGTSHTTYSYSGNTVTVTDPGGRWKKYTSDVFGNVIQVNEPNPAGGADYVTQYTYNAFDKLTTVTMPRTVPGGNVVTQTRSFVYDSTQHLTSVTHPESGTTTYTYDSAGRVLTKTDAKNNKVAYTYDLYNRLTKITRTPGSGTVEPERATTFTYDTAPAATGLPSGVEVYLHPANTWGRVAMITHGSLSVERFQYTPSGRISAKSLSTIGTYPSGGTEQLPFIGNFQWDSEGRLSQFSGYAYVDPVSTGTVTKIQIGNRTWTYDSLGRPLGLNYAHFNSDAVPLAQNATYNAAGQLTSYQFPVTFQDTGSGDITYGVAPLQFTYNSLGQMTEEFSNSPGPSYLMPDIQYQYSATANDGRIQSRVFSYATFYAPGQSTTSAYSYDSLGRLTAVAGSQSFVYDPFGNLLQENVIGGSAPALNITVDPTTNRINTSGFVYDAAGNLTQTPDGKSYTYDSENRMSQGNEGTYYYDANGERVASVASSGIGTWYFHGPNGIELNLTSGTGCGQYGILYSGFCVAAGPQGSHEKLYFAGRLVLQGDTSSGEGVTTVTDRLGSVVQTSRNVGGVADYDYYPYGGGLSGLQPNQTSFATYEVAGTSMLYAKNRFYDSARGRFTSTDPYDGSMDLKTPLSFNRYAYVMGDPINSSDPSGLCTIGGVVYPDGLPPCPDITGVTVYGGGFGSFGGGGSGGGTGGRNTLTPSQLQMQMADTHPGYVPVYISPKVETITSCETGVVYAGIAAGIATALGVGPPGSDPSNDLAQEIAKAVGNPSAGMQVSGVIYSALRTLLTGPAAAEISAYIGADLVPVAGWAATGYLVYEAVMGYKDYYESHIGSCHH